MRLSLVTAPAAELATTAEAKSWLRVSHSSEDTLIDGLVKSARGFAEGFTNRAFVNQTWELSMDTFPGCREIELPLPPLSSVTSVKYYDTAGTQQTMSSADYTVKVWAGDYAPYGSIVLGYGKSWPSSRGYIDDVTIRFVAGYGAAASNVPELIKSAVKQLVAQMYDQRGEDVVGLTVQKPTLAARNLLWPFRVGIV